MNRILLFSSGSICRSIILESLLRPEIEKFSDIELYSSGMHYDPIDVQNTLLLLKENYHRANHLNYKLHDEIFEQTFDITFIIVDFLNESTYELLPKIEVYYIGYRGVHNDLEGMYHYVKKNLIAPIKQCILRDIKEPI